MHPCDEIAALSDAALMEIQEMCNTQYKLGADYACHCMGVNINVENDLANVVVPLDASYFRCLVLGRKHNQVEKQNVKIAVQCSVE